MDRSSYLRLPLTGLVIIFLSIGLSYAQDAVPSSSVKQPVTPSSLVERYPSGSIQSVEAADHAIEEVNQARSGVETQFAEDAHALAQLRPIEINANAFKRRDRVVERDKALAEKAAKEEAEAPQREQQQQEREAALAKKSTTNESDPKARENVEAKNRADYSKRVAEHEAKLQREKAEEAANAKKRAENIAAYEKKVREAEARQRAIAEKKAGK
jgi:colicin import membrane protein